MVITLTLGCGSWESNITTEEITPKHMVNFTRVPKPIPRVVPDEEAIFGVYLAKYGK